MKGQVMATATQQQKVDSLVAKIRAIESEINSFAFSAAQRPVANAANSALESGVAQLGKIKSMP